MSLFDSIISEADAKFDLGGRAGNLLSALLALMTDKNRGGFAGFLDSFQSHGVSNVAPSWSGARENVPLSDEQLELALGRDTVREIAAQTGIAQPTATSALASMVPRVIDTLTPGGAVPAETDLLSRIGGYLSGSNATGTLGATGAATSGTFDRIGTAADDTSDQGNTVLSGASFAAVDSRRGFGEESPVAINQTDHAIDDDAENSILDWLLPLVLLALAVILGIWFCGKASASSPPANININANANGRVFSDAAFLTS